MEERNDDGAQGEETEHGDPIRLPAGWGPIAFLAAVMVACSLCLGFYLRGLILSHPQGPAVTVGGPVEGGSAMPKGPEGGPQRPQSEYQVDESAFTPELDARIKQVAAEHGLPADQVGSARELFQQMQRSGLLPQSADIDLETVLIGHLTEIAKSGSGDQGGGTAPQGPPPAGAPGGEPGMMPPPPDVPPQAPSGR